MVYCFEWKKIIVLTCICKSCLGFPLAVKLGTITADGKADVYSYTEDEMVIDPNLVRHLSVSDYFL